MAKLAENLGTVGGLRDALLLRIMSDGMLRVGEAEALTVADIIFETDWLGVVVRRSKTDQEGRGEVAYGGPETARLARGWLQTAGIVDGALFRRVNKAGAVGDKLGAHSMRAIIKRYAARAGLRGRFSGHSPRVGAAQSLRRRGAELPELMAAGRWQRPETMALYTRVQDAALGPVARYRYGAVPSAQGILLERLAGLESQVTAVLTELQHVHSEMKCMHEELVALRGGKNSAKALADRENAVIGSINAD